MTNREEAEKEIVRAIAQSKALLEYELVFAPDCHREKITGDIQACWRLLKKLKKSFAERPPGALMH